MLMMFRKPEKMTKGGFSLPEVILSIFILLVGILPVFKSMEVGLTESLNSGNVIIASELAQEGTELVQNVRDNSFALGGKGFETFSLAKNSDQFDCHIDYIDYLHTTGSVNKNVFTHPTTGQIGCKGSSMSLVYYDLTLDASGFYRNDDTSSGKFNRKLFLIAEDRSVGNFLDYTWAWKVYSIVYWGTTIPTRVDGLSDCTASNKCVYAVTELRAWK